MKKLIFVLVLLFCFIISLAVLSGCAKKEAEQPPAEEVTEEAPAADTTAVPVDTTVAEEPTEMM